MALPGAIWPKRAKMAQKGVPEGVFGGPRGPFPWPRPVKMAILAKKGSFLDPFLEPPFSGEPMLCMLKWPFLAILRPKRGSKKGPKWPFWPLNHWIQRVPGGQKGSDYGLDSIGEGPWTGLRGSKWPKWLKRAILAYFGHFGHIWPSGTPQNGQNGHIWPYWPYLAI